MKRILTTITAALFAAITFAQSGNDAFQFAQTCYQGTAKALGMANALGAVGGDMTAVCINPAGLGLYRGPELTMSLNLLDNYCSSNYYDTRDGANKMRLTIPNLGFVHVKERSNFRPLRFTQFGIGLTRTNDYNIRTAAKGINPTSSMIDSYLPQIDGFSNTDIQDAFPYTIFPAWQTYLIDIFQDSIGDYYSSPVPQGGIWQSLERNSTGRSEEWTFAGSANYNDRLFIGGSIGLSHVKRKYNGVFEEWMPDNSLIDTDFNEWLFTESITSTGWGGNLKLGLIYHASSWLRFGAAFHSPSVYSFEETWQTETESKINYVTRKYISPESHYEYTFFSPLKWMGSIAFVIAQQSIISLDAEYTNYGASRFRADDWDYSATNADIKATYGRTFNFRFGSEWHFDDCCFRLGAGYYGSPFGLGNANGSVKKASAGISYQLSLETTLDIAYELSYGKNRFTLYDAGSLGIDPVKQRQFRSNLAFTLRIH